MRKKLLAWCLIAATTMSHLADPVYAAVHTAGWQNGTETYSIPVREDVMQKQYGLVSETGDVFQMRTASDSLIKPVTGGNRDIGMVNHRKGTEESFLSETPSEIPGYYRETDTAGLYEFMDRYGKRCFRRYGFFRENISDTGIASDSDAKMSEPVLYEGKSAAPSPASGWYTAEESGEVLAGRTAIDLEREYETLAPYLYEAAGETEVGEECFRELLGFHTELSSVYEAGEPFFMSRYGENWDGSRYGVWDFTDFEHMQSEDDYQYWFYGHILNAPSAENRWIRVSNHGAMYETVESYYGEPENHAKLAYNAGMSVKAYADRERGRIVIQVKNCRLDNKGSGYTNGQRSVGMNGLNFFIRGNTSRIGEGTGYQSARKGSNLPENAYFDYLVIGNLSADTAPGDTITWQTGRTGTKPFQYYYSTSDVKVDGCYRDYQTFTAGDGLPYYEIGYNEENPSDQVYDWKAGTMSFYVYNLPENLTDIALTPWCTILDTSTNPDEDYSAYSYYRGRVLLSEQGFSVPELIRQLNQTEISVRFDANGGTGGTTVTAAPGAAFGTLPGAPTRDGYTFAGWYTQASGGTRVTAQTLVPDTDVTYYAHWDEKHYNITYVLNGGTAPSGLPSSYYGSQGVGSFAAPSRNGYTFGGWNPSSIPKGSTGDKTVTASWTPVTYQITYMMNGGTNHAGNPSSYTIEDAVHFSEPTRAGYRFTGWSPSEISRGSTGAKTITASWSPEQYSIRYVLDGGVNHTGNPSNYTVEDTVRFSPPTKNGYRFLGWSPSEIPRGSTGEKTVTAAWEANEYAILFDANGGTGTTSYQRRHDDTLGELPQAFRTGYTFLGWYTQKDGGTQGKSSDRVTGQKTYYAHWVINRYTARFHSAGTGDGATILRDYGAALGELPETQRTGYQFGGWFTTAEGGTQISSSTLMGADDADYYAHWEANRWTVIYDAGKGSGQMEASSFTYDAENVLSANTFTRSGYHFAGWAEEPDGSISFTDSARAGNMTKKQNDMLHLYAVWEANPYTVTLHRHRTPDDTVSLVQSYIYDREGTLPEKAFEKTGYSFTGWSKTPSGSDELVPEGADVLNWTQEPDGNIDLYAQWEPNTYRLYYGAGGGQIADRYKLVTYDAPVGELLVPVRTNYRFTGWTMSGTPVTTDTVYQTPGSMYIYAQWELNYRNQEETNTNIRPGKDGEFGTGDDEVYTNGPDGIVDTEDDREVFPGADGVYGTEDDYYILNPPKGDRIYAGADRRFNSADDYIDNGNHTITHPGKDCYFGKEPGAPENADTDNTVWWKGNDGKTGTAETAADDRMVYPGKDGVYHTEDDFVPNSDDTNLRPGPDRMFGTEDDMTAFNGKDGLPGTDDDFIHIEDLGINRRPGEDCIFSTENKRSRSGNLTDSGDDIWYWDGPDKIPGTADDVAIYPGTDGVYGSRDDFYYYIKAPYKGNEVYAGIDGRFGTADDYMDLGSGKNMNLRPGKNAGIGDADDELWFNGRDGKPGTEDDRLIQRPYNTGGALEAGKDSFYENEDGHAVYPGSDLCFGTGDDRVDTGRGSNVSLEGLDERTNGADGIPGTADDRPIHTDENGGDYFEREEDGKRVYPGADGCFGTKDDRIDTGFGTNTGMDGKDEKTNGVDKIPGTEDDITVHRDPSGAPYIENGDGSITRTGKDGSFGTTDDESYVILPGKKPGEDDRPIKTDADGRPYVDNGDGTVTRPGEDGKWNTEDDEKWYIGEDKKPGTKDDKPVKQDENGKEYVDNEDGTVTRPGSDGKWNTEDDEKWYIGEDKKPGTKDDKPVKQDENGKEYVDNGDGTVTRPGSDGKWNTEDDEKWYIGEDKKPGTKDDKPVKKDENGKEYIDNGDGTVTRPGSDGKWNTEDDEKWYIGEDKKPGTKDDKPVKKDENGNEYTENGDGTILRPGEDGKWNTKDDEIWYIGPDQKPGTADDKPVKKDENGNPYVENGDGSILRPGDDNQWGTNDDEKWYTGEDKKPGTADDRPIRKDDSGNEYVENSDGSTTSPGKDGIWGTDDDETTGGNHTGGNGSGSAGGSGSGGSGLSFGGGVKGSRRGSGKNAVSAEFMSGTWMLDSVGWWYRYENGTWPAGQWLYLSWQNRSDWYYFNDAGYMVTGWYHDTAAGCWYYLHPKADGTRGHMYTGWHLIDGKYYYFNSSGRLLVNCVTPDGYRVNTLGEWETSGRQ